MNNKKLFMVFTICLTILFSIGCSKKRELLQGIDKKLKGKINISVSKERVGYISKYVEEFNKIYPNVEIHIKQENSNYRPSDEKELENMDIVVIKNEYTQYFLNNFSKNIYNIEEIISPYKGNFSNDSIVGVSSNNKIYGMPLDKNPYIMVYRKDLLDKCNIKIEDIKTWQDHINVSKYINKTLKGNYKFLWERDKSYLYKVMLSQLSEGYVDSNGKSTIASAKSIKVLDMIKKFKSENVILQDNSNASLIEKIRTGILGATICSANEISEIMNKLPEMKNKLVVSKIPAFEAGGNRDISMNGYNMIFLNKDKNKDLMATFSEFILNDEKLQLQLYVSKGILPANTSIYKAEELNKNVDYFNEKIWLLIVSIQKESKNIVYPASYIEIDNLIKKNINKIYDNNGDIKPLLKSMENNINNIINESPSKS
ncbi:ABC-type glycerol-3-phosphate transport system substrate-binding protein [Clostridium tetanomorphum]|uniref:Carbohydrate ABC transporter substrate-binding protein n=1 Tax=Clostridium tetanomorphum TaxID=1553 RepID=A0A923J2E1_CLOTT|nr:ABC transporter substrate-binding protein [Clostridium tetanomorphum]KAJ53305.1 ABC transporter substrate-binding protein [Clostridium tetanomorphum DSM 665]MBC2400166.1 carbohydrate ABC transporter substrate-binding protein [Clostridium tetanomorphum]MBP1865663.1 ABC-type glycerol-3-phosphate transport system substrate-binding protein [Clostridium tetanomorphum]NRS86783.1 ABC-type glycerol-3-phosphate transport system substrate-binding protein [Clostridium tetanomorphum]NRZ99462.1 ABC-type